MERERGLIGRLKEHSWIDAIRHYRNKSDIVNGLVFRGKRDLDELITIAEKAPDAEGRKNIQEEIFTDEKIQRLLIALLRTTERRTADPRRARLAALAARVATEKIMSQYEIAEPQLALRTQNTRVLKDAGQICSAIAYKLGSEYAVSRLEAAYRLERHGRNKKKIESKS